MRAVGFTKKGAPGAPSTLFFFLLERAVRRVVGSFGFVMISTTDPIKRKCNLPSSAIERESIAKLRPGRGGVWVSSIHEDPSHCQEREERNGHAATYPVGPCGAGKSTPHG